MESIELRDLDKARQFLYQGLWLQRVIHPPAPRLVKDILNWGLEIASAGEPLPPIGFVADVGIVAFNLDRGEKKPREQAQPGPELPSVLARTYEDHVLGKIYADWTFERASDALRKYSPGRDWSRGLAFMIRQFRRRAKFTGVLLSPSILRSSREMPEQDVLEEGRRSWEKEGLFPLLETCYRSMVESARRTAEILEEADVRALENGIALQEEGQQLAHEQVMLAAKQLRDELPHYKVKPLAGRHEVPTRVLDEDTYPVGGYASISTRGTLESLLHSQLAYMETDVRPDLFDLKYLRDELFYYSRDENQFLRRRRTFVFVFYPDLVQARFKDPELRFQRVVMLLGLIYAGVAKLCEWLSTDALHFDFVFLTDGESLPLTHEHGLIRMLFREHIENRTMEVFPALKEGKIDKPWTEERMSQHCQARSQRSLCHCLILSTQDQLWDMEETVVSRLVVDGAQPSLGYCDEEIQPMDDWAPALERLLQIWV
jgi:hypothetical protein